MTCSPQPCQGLALLNGECQVLYKVCPALVQQDFWGGIAIVTTARMFQLLLWLLLEASHEEVVVGLPAHFHQSLSLGHVWKGLLCQFSQLQDVLRMEGSRYEPGVGVVIP